jgi:hypothetical protein
VSDLATVHVVGLRALPPVTLALVRARAEEMRTTLVPRPRHRKTALRTVIRPMIRTAIRMVVDAFRAARGAVAQ